MLTRTLCALALASATTAASAAVIPFDPDGPGPAPVANVASFDFLPGNALIVSSQNPAGAPQAVLYYQARLDSLIGAGGQIINTPGLNAPPSAPNSHEITAVFAVSVNPVLVGAGVVAFTPVVGAPRYFSLYHDLTPDASDLAGTGFRDGLRIAGGDTTFGNGVFSSSPGGAQPLDQFAADNYPGTSTLVGIGGFRAAGDVTSVAPAFFPAGPLMSFLHDTTLATAYFHIDPSATFEIGPDGLTTVHVVSVGPLNIATPPESILESDGALTFTLIPEPASLSLLALLPLATRRRRRA